MRFPSAQLLLIHERAMSPQKCVRDAVSGWLWARQFGWEPYGPNPDGVWYAARNEAKAHPLIWC